MFIPNFILTYLLACIFQQDYITVFMSLCHAPVISTPAVIHTVSRFLIDLYRDDHTIPRFRLHPLTLTEHSRKLFKSLYFRPFTAFLLIPFSKPHRKYFNKLSKTIDAYLKMRRAFGDHMRQSPNAPL